MQSHQERVVIERDELSAKVEKLDTFIYGTIYNSLQLDEQIRLLKQFAYMSLYLDILNERIKAF